MKPFRCSGCGSIQRRPAATMRRKRCTFCRALLEPIDEPEEPDEPVEPVEPVEPIEVDDDWDEDEPAIEDLGIHVERHAIRSAAHLAAWGQLRTSLGWVGFDEEVTIEAPTSPQLVGARLVAQHLRELGYRRVEIQLRHAANGGA